MKLLKYLVPIVLLVAVTGCNQTEDPATLPAISNPSALAASVTVVEVDIIPHNPANRINCAGKNRLISVAIITTDDFDAMDVDHATVNFEGAYEAHIDDETGEPVRHTIDVNGDGDLDLVLHFLYRKTDLNCDSKEGCLTGEIYLGGDIYGCDFIKMFHK
ncbi:MAG: hypothetical protein JSV52_15295 [Candidatus Zixiibacteriota bacterium]|nr:MAG: hypothetical protein JSV52_15295 [candidate division Zixibacteria bacterium]